MRVRRVVNTKNEKAKNRHVRRGSQITIGGGGGGGDGETNGGSEEDTISRDSKVHIHSTGPIVAISIRHIKNVHSQ